jgi:hypothetical protein
VSKLGALLGGATALGAALAPQDAEAGIITKGGKKLIEAWHGSPHVFDKFDISKIGTGEGAQAYGHGLYFADEKGTAIDYRDKLSRPAADDAYKTVLRLNDKLGAGLSAREASWIESGIRNGQPTDSVINDFVSAFPEWAGVDTESFNTLRTLVDEGKGGIPKGSLYRTHIDVNPDSLLDYDTPLYQQDAIIEKLGIRDEINQYLKNDDELTTLMNNGGLDSPRWNELIADSSAIRQRTGVDPLGHGKDFYNTIAGQQNVRNPGPEDANVKASNWLRDNGITGIRYRDQMSRGDAAEPTYNYVMFDDKPITIVERGNATPQALAATATATAAGIAANNFHQRRASKADYWKQKRQEVLEFASSLPEAIGTALDMPLRGYMGLSGVAGTLASGGGFNQALQQGARIAAQPTDTTAYQYGQTVTDTLSPYVPDQVAAGAGALTNAGVLLGSPL